VFLVRLPDPVITIDEIKSWSSNVESALFPRPIEPRSFLLVLKNDVKDVKKEIESLLAKVKFGGKKIEIEEKREAGDEQRSADMIDPYTLYVTNLDPEVTKDDLRGLFPGAKSVLNPRKHNPRVQGGATAASSASSATKFAFVSFATAEEALTAFKGAFNRVFKGGRGLVLRFRRVSKAEAQQARAQLDNQNKAAVKKEEDKAKTEVAKVEGGKKGAIAAAPAAGKKAGGVVVKQEPKKGQQEEEEDSDEDDDEEEEDDEMEVRII